jgi:hypothetical protein
VIDHLHGSHSLLSSILFLVSVICLVLLAMFLIPTITAHLLFFHVYLLFSTISFLKLASSFYFFLLLVYLSLHYVNLPNAHHHANLFCIVS